MCLHTSFIIYGLPSDNVISILETCPNSHGGYSRVDHSSLASVDCSGFGSITEGWQLALKRSTRLWLSGVKDGVAGSKVTPVGVEQLNTECVLWAKSWSVHNMGHLVGSGKIGFTGTWTGNIDIAAWFFLQFPNFESCVKTRVWGLESCFDNFKRTSDDCSCSSTDTEKFRRCWMTICMTLWKSM